ncbi:hypothetical protein [Azospirillum sp. TSO5]|uniref:hypothetical protein n=1 Tax=Azospirillum sp. TSO5 TaxID=716760 RepID=UPI000D62047D|nr:hypothetical protein [Azospirillum sp. TSO5]PWC96974.1 hypothetical protein TSO5_05970 [Azospirillum sp. TSO5]
MSLLASLLGSRFGLAGVVAVIMGLVVGGLWLDRSSLKADVAQRDATIAARDATIAEQNAAVDRMRADALAASQAASDRAKAVLKPRPKPSTATVQELNQWLVSK